MNRPSQIEDFIPHRTPIDLTDIRAALADLDPVARGGGLSVPLPYTERADGTLDTIEIGSYGGTADWMVYTGRVYRGQGFGNITAEVARCPGYMVILVVRAMYAHLTAVGPQGRAGTVEGDVLYALGLVRDTEETTP